MKKITQKLLFITEDFPSGLNGTSVKTRNTLEYLLELGYKIDVCCFHFDGFKVHNFTHPNLKIYTVKSSQVQKFSASFYYRVFSLLFTFVPFTIKRLFNPKIKDTVDTLLAKNEYSTVIYDGYSTLQYLRSDSTQEKIYIDDEDFTDLFFQRFLLEKNYVKKIFYLHEYLKSLVYERYFLRKVTQVWAISLRTLRRLRMVSQVKTVVMPTIIPKEKYLYTGKSLQIMFTGTLNWRENVEGLKWFISAHWNTILDSFPDAILVVIGQGASDEFISYLSQYKNIIYKGYVKSLELEYKKTSVAIAPVRINAGIKVKILTYMSYGLPVVSTKKAAWGLVSRDGLLVSSDANFARSVIVMLKSAQLQSTLSQMAYANISNNYSKKQLDHFLSQNLK